MSDLLSTRRPSTHDLEDRIFAIGTPTPSLTGDDSPGTFQDRPSNQRAQNDGSYLPLREVDSNRFEGPSNLSGFEPHQDDFESESMSLDAFSSFSIGDPHHDSAYNDKMYRLELLNFDNSSMDSKGLSDLFDWSKKKVEVEFIPDSSYFSYVEGRRFHNFPIEDVTYYYPNDEEELNRLEFQHEAYKILLGTSHPLHHNIIVNL
jgi:hypothetical protein